MVSMERLQEVDHVVTAFRRYVDTDDKTLVDKIPNNELEKTLNIYASSSGDTKSGWHKAIERELERREKSKDYKAGIIRGIIIGVVSTVVGGLILWYIVTQLSEK